MLIHRICPQCGYQTQEYRNPKSTADVIVDIGGKILLINRKNPPYGWAIPGGFIDYGEGAEDAAIREIREEAGIEVRDLTQFHFYSDPGRDPRHHTVTIVFTARSDGIPKAGDDAAEYGLFEENQLPSPLAFDHERILADYFRARREGKIHPD
jgi:ADP-ribose pyrophosphatase YjhB (NUDIX family)